MQIFYSKTAGGFFNSAIHSDMPVDRVEISRDDWLALLEGQAFGKSIQGDEAGRPVLVDPVVDAAVAERKWRDGELLTVTWLRDRHRDQLDMAADTTLTAEQFTELLVYMQQLRDWPQAEAFPLIEQRPVAPPWVTEQTP